MRGGISLCACFLLCITAIAKDKDTTPLSDRTSPTQNGERLESKLLNPGQPISSRRGGKTKSGGSSATLDGSHPSDRPYIASLDVFGSTRINSVVLRKTLGKDLDLWFKKGLASDPTSTDLEHKLANRIKKTFDLAFAEWSVVQYFEPNNLAIHVTLDTIEKADVARRMPFLPEPTELYPDPGNLIKQWMDYEDAALALVQKGALEPDSEECPAFHCPFGHKHPSLKKYEKLFVEGVTNHEKSLTQILDKDRRPEFRGSAAYLLAYLKDGRKVVKLMTDHIRDSNDLVRNNVMRVLGDIAEYHPDLIIPTKPIMEALVFPRVSDRTKALFVAYAMAMNSSEARAEMLKNEVPDLLALLDSQQPDQRDVAGVILKKISGKDFAANDLKSWSRWADQLPKDRDITKK